MSKRRPHVTAPEEDSYSDFMLTVMGRAVMSLEGRLLRVNPSFCKMLGYSEEELLSRTEADITHLEDLPPGREFANRMLAGEIDSFRRP